MLASDKLSGTFAAHLAHTLSAAVGQAVVGLLTHPTDTLKSNKVKHNGNYTLQNLWEDRMMVLNSLPTNVIETVSFVSVFEFAVSIIREQYLKSSKNKTIGVAPSILIGMVCGGITQLTSCPLKVIALSIQTGQYKSFSEACVGIYNKDNGGILNFWKGVKVSLIISSINPAIDYEVYGRCASLVLSFNPQSKGDIRNLSSLQVFLLGLFAKFVAATITYPINTIKLQTQIASTPDDNNNNNNNNKVATTGEKSRSSNEGPMQLAKKLYNKGGILGFYPGYGAKMTNTMLKSGIRRTIMSNIRERTYEFVLFFLMYNGSVKK